MAKTRVAGLVVAGLMAVAGFAQKPVAVERPDSQRIRDEFVEILGKYPPTVRAVLSLDPALIGNKEYLQPYPALAEYLTSHPEVARDPVFYVGRMGREFQFSTGAGGDERSRLDRILSDLGVFAGFGMAIGLFTWLIRTLLDYRRWHRLANVQTNVHTKLLDRFTSNEDLMAYMQTPSGAKFLESSPISLDPGPKQMGAPQSRILWSVQVGFVLVALGIGFRMAGLGIDTESDQTMKVLGTLALALGVGFAGSALISWAISLRMGLLDKKPETTSTQG